jgi:antitoxin component of RelBE/YafQ-DinJ toxin-antitoxin module
LCLSVCNAIRLSLVYGAAEKALSFSIKVPNAEIRAAVAQLERREDRSFDSVAELLADLNAGMERDTGFAVLAWPAGASF